jgi:aminomethyltransferase
MFEIGPNTRLRVSPFFEKLWKRASQRFHPYNKMLMPVSYGHPMARI